GRYSERGGVAAKIIRRALRNISLCKSWGVSSLCYAKARHRILENPIHQIPKMFRGLTTDALVKNSPFGFLHRQQKFYKQLFFMNFANSTDLASSH
ncbi:hypothetical protein, partial [Xanthomonas perforans]|uniref:hypothetical protein n=1 Tax=Xanthomonas perforans TaxID=442694 RepID=UPI001C636AA0